MAKIKERASASAKATVKNGTLFVCALNPEAKEVFLVGDFNDWDPKGVRMVKRKGTFEKRLYLKPGEYQYKFIVDGEWHTDPSAETHLPNGFGTMNSVIRV